MTSGISDEVKEKVEEDTDCRDDYDGVSCGTSEWRFFENDPVTSFPCPVLFYQRLETRVG
eukprot:scaffold258453_cov32-Prasinocladus_malaysianus.AAC.1